MDIERVRAVISQLTPEEKAELCGCGLSLVTKDNPKYKVYSVIFPNEFLLYREDLTALACTFDRELMRVFGAQKAANAKKNGEAVNGVINIGVIRDPMAVGSEKMLSEDPLVVEQMASAFIEGAGKRVFASGIFGGEIRCAERVIDDRALNELYLRPFIRLAKRLAGVLMPSGTLNGELISESKSIVSKIASTLPSYALIANEVGSVHSKTNAVSTGVCFEVGDTKQGNMAMVEDIKNGRLFEKKLDMCLERYIMYVATYYESIKTEPQIPEAAFNFEERLCKESIVMLKNDGILPLADSVKYSVAGDVDKASAPFFGGELAKGASFEHDTVVLVAKYIDGKISLNAQKSLNAAVESNKKIIMCVITPRAVQLDSLDKINAVLYIPQMLANTAQAVRDILLGKENPCGKLSFSWAESSSHYPSQRQEKLRERGMFCYESVANGYRFFNSFSQKTLFPFGHGLGYSTFDYFNPSASINGDVLHIEFVAKNVGEYAATETVFVFGKMLDANLFGLKSRLIAFKRIQLEKNENTRAIFDVNIDELAVFDSENNSYFLHGGKLEIMICRNAESVVKSLVIKLPRTSKNTLGLNPKTIPSYFEQGDFNPKGTDIEKVMKSPIIVKKSENPAHILHDKDTKKLEKKIYKKIKKAGKNDLSCDITGLSKFAIEKILNDCKS